MDATTVAVDLAKVSGPASFDWCYSSAEREEIGP